MYSCHQAIGIGCERKPDGPIWYYFILDRVYENKKRKETQREKKSVCFGSWIIEKARKSFSSNSTYHLYLRFFLVPGLVSDHRNCDWKPTTNYSLLKTQPINWHGIDTELDTPVVQPGVCLTRCVKTGRSGRLACRVVQYTWQQWTNPYWLKVSLMGDGEESQPPTGM